MRQGSQLRITSGGGVLALFGAPFLLVGIAVLTSPLWGHPTMDGTDQPVPLFPLIAFGGIFGSVGAGFMFGRRGITVDRAAGTATSWWGLLVPFRSTTRPLSDFDRVQVTREVRRSDKNTRIVFPVRLAGPGQPLLVREQQSYDRSRALAEEVAKHCDLGVHDSSSGQDIVREAGTLDESIRDRARRTGELVEAPSRPAGARSRVEVQGRAMVIELPASGFQGRHALVLGAGVLGALMFAVPVLGVFGSRGGGAGLGVRLAVLLPVCVLGPLAVAGTLWFQTRTRHRISVSPRELEIRTLRPVGSSTLAIPADELEELEVDEATRGGAGLAALLGAPGKLIARSDRASTVVRCNVDPDELRWLRDTLHYVLTSS